MSGVAWATARRLQIRPAGADRVYFVDFVCRKQRVIVEVDGATHGRDAEIAADELRTAELQALVYRLVRVSNEDVYRNVDGVLDTVLAVLTGDEV